MIDQPIEFRYFDISTPISQNNESVLAVFQPSPLSFSRLYAFPGYRETDSDSFRRKAFYERLCWDPSTRLLSRKIVV